MKLGVSYYSVICVEVRCYAFEVKSLEIDNETLSHTGMSSGSTFKFPERNPVCLRLKVLLRSSYSE